MLKLISNNKEIDLGSVKSISISINPGIFEMESFFGSYAIPFQLPVNEINNPIFQFQHKFNSPLREIVKIDAELWHSGLLLFRGILEGTLYSDTTIDCNFLFQNGEVFNNFNSKKLNEWDFGDEKTFVVKELYDVETDDFVLYPVKNPDYFKGTIYETDTSEHAITQNLFVANTLQFATTGAYIITPFPLLWRVLQYLFSNLNFNYTDTYFTQQHFKTINIFNTFNLVSFYYEIYQGKRYVRNKKDNYNLANHVPAIETSEFIKALQVFFNVFFYVHGDTIQVIDRKAMIQSADYDDISTRQVGTYTKELSGIVYSGVAINIQRDSNDSNVKDLENCADLKDVHFIDGYAEAIVDPAPYLNVFNQNGVYDAFKFANYWQFVNQQDIYPDSLLTDWLWYPYAPRWNYGFNKEHESFCNQNGFYLGEKGFEISANLSPLSIWFFGTTSTTDYTYIMPRVKQQGNSVIHKQKTPFSLRLMQYQGRKDDVEGLTLPLGAFNNDTVYINAYWSYMQRWKEFIEWYVEAQKEEYKFKLQLSASEIKNFDFTRKKLVDKNLFFIKSMQITLTRTEIKAAECIAIKA